MPRMLIISFSPLFRYCAAATLYDEEAIWLRQRVADAAFISLRQPLPLIIAPPAIEMRHAMILIFMPRLLMS